MLKTATDPETTSRSEITHLVNRLQSDGRRWAMAEAELAKVELIELRSKVIRVAVFAVVSFAAVFCALVAFSQAGIAFLTPYVGSVGVAALIVGGILLLVVAVSIVMMRSALSWQTESVFFRWFGRGLDART